MVLMDCVFPRFVVDSVVKNDAIAVFFSEEDDVFVKNLSASDNLEI